jgi:hypothetical protein
MQGSAASGASLQALNFSEASGAASAELTRSGGSGRGLPAAVFQAFQTFGAGAPDVGHRGGTAPSG